MSDSTTGAFPRRYAKACDTCYQKKIKCVASDDATRCGPCSRAGHECIFTRRELAPRKRRRGKHITALEERLNKMETMLTHNTRREPLSPRSQSSSASSSEENDDDLSFLDHQPSVRKLVMRRRGCADQRTALRQLRSAGWISSSGNHIFPRLDKALGLIQGYFTAFNHYQPIFLKKHFMRRIESDYPPDKDKDLAWWTCVAGVLCKAHQLRVMTEGLMNDEDMHVPICFYWGQILDAVSVLVYDTPSLESAQALLLTAVLSKSSPHKNIASQCLSNAVQILQSLDIHREGLTHSRLSYYQNLERRRLFWTSYILDADISMRNQRPPILHDQECSVSPLTEHTDDRLGTILSLDGCQEVNLLALNEELARLQKTVWTVLCSANAFCYPGSTPDLSKENSNLALISWKNDLPFKLKVDELIHRWPKLAVIHMVRLQFTYFHTLACINRDPDLAELDVECSSALSCYPVSTSAIVVEAARDTLTLGSLIPRGRYAEVFEQLDTSILATLCLMFYFHQHPLEPACQQDLEMVDLWLHFFDRVVGGFGSAELEVKQGMLRQVRRWIVMARVGRGDGGGGGLDVMGGNEECGLGFAGGAEVEALDTSWVQEWSFLQCVPSQS